MSLNVHEIDYREHLPRGVLDPFGPDGEPVFTPTDRRLLWHIECSLSVLATTERQRDLIAVLQRYLYDTCEHHWTFGTDYDDLPLRQCLWCNQTEWKLPDGSSGEPAARTGGAMTETVARRELIGVVSPGRTNRPGSAHLAYEQQPKALCGKAIDDDTWTTDSVAGARTRLDRCGRCLP